MKESERLAKIIDSVVAICFVVWLFVILRFPLYGRCRMAALRLSCVRQHRWLGVLQYVASVKESSPVKSGGLAWVGGALAGSVPHTLPASQLDQAGPRHQFYTVQWG